MSTRPEFEPYKRPVPPPDSEKQPTKFGASNFLGGLITDADPAIIPENSLQLGSINFTYIKNRLVRRNGLQAYSLAKPDSNPILAIIAYKHETYGIQFLRFTAGAINRGSNTGWALATGPALVGGVNDRYSMTVADQRLMFANNGANVIMEYLPATNTWAALGNAPQYRFITSAFNRIIGANLKGAPGVPYQIGWSGDLNYSQWNQGTDISAGNTPLVNTPADLSDDITGLFNLSSILCITRQKSIWLATNLPSASNPFNFFPDVPRIGADTPNTIQVIDDGLVFYNFQKSTVYKYVPGQKPVVLSDAIKRELKTAITSPINLYSSYDGDLNVYSLYLFSDTSSVVKVFSYHFETSNWVYDEWNSVRSVSNLEYASSDITIDQLTGTINSLLGTIDQLGGLVANSSRFFGFNDGTLCTQPLWLPKIEFINNIQINDNGTPFTTAIRSKSFSVQDEESIFNKLSLKYTPFSTGTLTVSYSKDGGQTFTVWKAISVISSMLYKPCFLLIKQPKRGLEFIWQVTTSDVMMALDNYAIDALDVGHATTTSK